MQQVRKLLDSVKEPIEPFMVFDLIAGTSTGALIAFGLVHGNRGWPMTVREVIKMYEQETGHIFRRDADDMPKTIKDKFSAWIFEMFMRRNPVPYSQKGLEIVLKEKFGEEATLKNLKSYHDGTCGAAAVARQFNEDPNQPDKLEIFETVDPAISYNVIQVLKASACAPVYFKGPTKIEGRNYVDGGLGGNCPLSLSIPRMQEIHHKKKLGIALSIAPPSRRVRRQLESLSEYKQYQYWMKYFPENMADGFASYVASKNNNKDGKFMRVTPKSPAAQKFRLDERDVAKMMEAMRSESTDPSQEYLEDILVPAMVVAVASNDDVFSEEFFQLIETAGKHAMGDDTRNEDALCLLAMVLDKLEMLERSRHDSRGREDELLKMKAQAAHLLGSTWIKANHYQKAITCLEKGLACQEEALGKGACHPDIAASYHKLGVCHSELGQFARAIPWFERGLRMLNEVHKGAGNGDIAELLTDLSFCYLDSGNAQERALKLAKQGLKMRRALHKKDPNHLDVAKSLTAVGNCQFDADNVKEALKLHERALKIRKAVYGSETSHPEISSALNNVANCYGGMGDHAKALEYYMLSLEMDREIYGKDANHQGIARSLDNIGLCYIDMGKFSEALMWHEQGLIMKRAIYGKEVNHPEIASSLESMSLCYSNLDDKLGEASDLLRQGLEMRRAIYGKDTNHPEVADNLYNLGLCEAEQFNYPAAAEAFNECLEMRTAIFGEDAVNTDMADILYAYGDCCRDLEVLPEAIELLEKCLRVRRAIHGEDAANSDMAEVLCALAYCYKDTGALSEAIELFKKCLQVMRAIHVENPEDEGITLCEEELEECRRMQREQKRE